MIEMLATQDLCRVSILQGIAQLGRIYCERGIHIRIRGGSLWIRVTGQSSAAVRWAICARLSWQHKLNMGGQDS